jgi:hypothetical protein
MTAAVSTFPGSGRTVAYAAHRSARGPQRYRSTTATRRRRTVVVLAVGIVLAAGKAGGALGGSPLAAPEQRPASVVRVVARPGDTLWSIASRLAPDRDPRRGGDQLTAARGGTHIVPGEIVEVPRS